MKIVATADLHGNLPDNVPECHVLVLGGDLCPDHPVGKAQRYTDIPRIANAEHQAEWLDGPFREWLDRQPVNNDVVAIWGNHDFIGEYPHLWPDLDWTLLQDSGCTIDGVEFYGTPWVPGLPRWAFYATEAALEARANLIPEGLDVLVTHGPPYGVADFVAPQFGSVHVGDPALTHAIPAKKPGIVICGHIHEQYGSHDLCDVRIENVAYVDERYRPRGTFLEFEV